MAQSGNRPPRQGGNRNPRSQRAPTSTPPKPRGGDGASTTDSPVQSAAERARERLDGQAAARGGARPKGSAQRARAASPQPRTRQARNQPNRSRSRRKASQSSSGRTAAIAGSIVVAVAVVVIVLVSVLTTSTTSSKDSIFFPSQRAPAAVVTAITNVSPAALTAAGIGDSGVTAKGPIQLLHNQPAYNVGSKAQLIYVGAEYCPYCAASRWPLTVALSRFGTFSGLQITKSSAYDYAPSTNTLTFATAKYTSSYLVFNATEETTNQCASSIVNGACPNGNYKLLQKATTFVGTLFQKYDNSPYVTSSQIGGIPFVYFGGRYVESGAIYLPTVLAGSNWQQIAQSTANPVSTMGKEILGAANIYTAAICKMTGDKPASVCGTSVIQLAAKALP